MGNFQLIVHKIMFLTLSKKAITISSKPQEFADNKFEFDLNGRSSKKQVENTVGKGEIARHKQFLLFPQCFQKMYTANT